MSSFEKAVRAFEGIRSDIQEILGKPMAIDPPITVTIDDLKALSDLIVSLDEMTEWSEEIGHALDALHAWVNRVAGDRAGEIYAADE
jgi:hypothetical protein